MFQSHGEIAGLALVSADYMAWVRKVPSSLGPNTNPVYAGILETIEERLRELRGMADTKHQVAFRKLLAALNGIEPCGRMLSQGLAAQETELQQRLEDITKYFQTQYNACALLSEQSQSIPYGENTEKEN